MPYAPPRACRAPGCPTPTTSRTGRCDFHERAVREAYDRQRGSAASRGYDARWRVIRDQVLARDPTCRWGSEARDRAVDPRPCSAPSTDAAHRIPREAGGRDELRNLRGLCHRHHSAETAARESWNRRRVR
jgi:5-methylcytosine-specific restriction protein A